jgi:hypothetical protein
LIIVAFNAKYNGQPLTNPIYSNNKERDENGKSSAHPLETEGMLEIGARQGEVITSELVAWFQPDIRTQTIRRLNALCEHNM